MARTPLAQAAQDAAARIRDEETRTTRRGLLAGAGAAIVGAATAGRFAQPARAAGAKVVVVGAGLAGLTCALRLKQAGVLADVYEASTRVGGRCWSGRGAFADGQIYEHGGELIDSGHLELKGLVHELGLDLDNLLQAEENGSELLGHFFGRPYTADQMSADLKTIWQQLHGDLSAAGYPTTYHSSTERGRELDAMSVAQWIDAYVPGGHRSPLARLLDVAYNIEYGAECTEQSALNLVYLLGYTGPGQFRIFGKSNEKYHVRGGNDQVPTRIAALLGSQIRTGTELVAIRRNGTGTFTLSFVNGAGSFQVVADHVVLALPFSILRASVDWSRAGFGREKTLAIQELGMGTNSKLHLQFSSRFWRGRGLTGETYSDRGYQSTWEVSRAQPGASGILVDYTGGVVGASFGSGSPSSRAAQFLAQLEPVLPGATAAWNGRATIDFWAGNPWTRGSYSYWKVGQYVRFGGAEGERSGNCYFAGEHTSQDFQGYLNGAVETGERAAAEILADLK
jgi:monoamine oxidase